jgi:hypothetical protein
VTGEIAVRDRAGKSPQQRRNPVKNHRIPKSKKPAE